MKSNIILIGLALLLFSGCQDIWIFEEVLSNKNVSFPAIDNFDITGKGTGTTKTTTGIQDNTIYEGFGVNDAVYGQWVLPSTIDTDKVATVTFNFFIPTAQVGKYANFSFDYTIYGGNKQVNVTSFSGHSNDIAIPETPYEYFSYNLPMDLSIIGTCTEHCVVNGKITRKASSNDPTGDINMFNMHVDYYDFKP